MDGMDYCEECEREHREEVKELMEQLKTKTQECEELKRYLKWIGISLGLNIDANFIGENAIEHWAVVHLSIENAIQDLKNKM